MKILVVDDDSAIRNGIEVFLKNNNHSILCAQNGNDALKQIDEHDFDLVITDMQMPEMDGIEFLKTIRSFNNPTPVIIITAFATIEKAVNSMQLGADDFLTKPINLKELLIKIDKVEASVKLKEENLKLKNKINKYDFPDIIGESIKMQELKNFIRKVASDKNVSVMIYGKSGTGKELVARNIHKQSERSGDPFIAINCAAIPDDLLESELFGYVAGAFTGANKSKKGIIAAADRGTLFLDEVSEMSARLQSKLLRVLQDHKVQPLGSLSVTDVNIRVIGASNVNLKTLVDKGAFREDLFYRLNVLEISVPSLSERAEDVASLVKHFINENTLAGCKKIIFEDDAMSLLSQYNWPGNIRELQNLVRMLSITSEGGIITSADLPSKILNVEKLEDENEKTNSSNFQTVLNNLVENFEHNFFKQQLQKHKGNVSRTAEAIGLSRVTLYKKIKYYKLN